MSIRAFSAAASATWPGRRIAGSRRTSFGTSFGARAASSNARRPPNEWPTRIDSRAPTVSTIASRCAPMSHGGSHGEWPCPSRSSATTWWSGSSRGERREVAPVVADAVQADDARSSGVAPLVERRASLGRGEHVERVRDHLGPPLVALHHQRPDHDAVAVDEERAAMRRAVRLVEDAVRLRCRAVRPEVGRERVLGAELLLPRLARGRRSRTRRRRSPCPRPGTTGGSPGGRAPRPRRPA